MKKRIVIVQCRLSSSRLPKKALKKLGNQTVLAWVLQSMKKVPASRYFVATDYSSFEYIKNICDENGFECFAGDLQDVLKRFVDLLNTVDCETVIRATADNPFLFYEAAIESVELFESKNSIEKKCDYLTFSGLPHGSGVEIFSASSLKKAASMTNDPYDHEHVGPALYNHKDLFNCEFINAPEKYNYHELRTTIDTYSDYLRAIMISSFLKNKNHPFSCEEIIDACQSDMVNNPVILYPSCKKGQGTGHLRRCLKLAVQNKFFIFIPNQKDLPEGFQLLDEIPTLIEEFLQNGLTENQIISKMPDSSYKPCIITDCFKLTQHDVALFGEAQKIISIDDDSIFDGYCDYSLEVIPPLSKSKKHNYFSFDFIEQPVNKKENKVNDFDKEIDFNQKYKILVCFGGEDPAGFSIPVSKSVQSLFKKSVITTIYSKPLQKSLIDKNFSKNVTFVPPVQNLKEKLFNYDIVITHYGLTAFEAKSAGCKVILCSPTKLHQKLAAKYDFSYVKCGKTDEKSIKNAFLNKKNNNFSKNQYENQNSQSEKEIFSDFISRISKGNKYLCPVCQKNQIIPDKIVSRNKFRTYRRCQNCSIVYISYSIEEKKVYESSYFFEDYQKQYGKTYQQDFDSIKNQGLRRINNIKKINSKLKNKDILDIGCAFGPFLAAAKENDMNPFGTDISNQAVSYVQKELKFPCSIAQFPKFDSQKTFGIQEFDFVTMWYVIEHFENLDEVLKKVSSLVKKGGIFAFSTPCGEGVSAKTNKDEFYQKSPSDHFSVWEKSTVKKIMKKYGFKVLKIVSTGHHPERFSYIKRRNLQSGCFQWNFFEFISKINKLGDTMEVYCKRIR